MVKKHFVLQFFFYNRNLRQKLHILNVFQKIRLTNKKNRSKYLKSQSKIAGFPTKFLDYSGFLQGANKAKKPFKIN